jgi:hypothetical protein
MLTQKKKVYNTLVFLEGIMKKRRLSSFWEVLEAAIGVYDLACRYADAFNNPKKCKQG